MGLATDRRLRRKTETWSKKHVTIVCLHDKARIVAFLRRNPALYTYAIGDLDDFYWPYTTWYALEREGTIHEICLMYSGTIPPTFLALSGEPDGEIRGFLRRLARLLPRRFDAHLSGDLVDMLRDEYTVDSYGTHYKM